MHFPPLFLFKLQMGKSRDFWDRNGRTRETVGEKQRGMRAKEDLLFLEGHLIYFCKKQNREGCTPQKSGGPNAWSLEQVVFFMGWKVASGIGKALYPFRGNFCLSPLVCARLPSSAQANCFQWGLLDWGQASLMNDLLTLDLNETGIANCL